jgi:hypothetical protein
MATLNTKFYLDLITSEHINKPKYKAWMTVLLTPFIDIINLNDQIKRAFDLNTAVGVQLDTLGKILVLNRQVTFQPTDGSSPILNDDYYRMILKAKVVKNQWKGTISNFYSFWNVLFQDQPLRVYLIDNQDMEPAVVVWSSQVTQMVQDLLANNYLIPKPAGLGLTVRRIDSDKILGFEGSSFEPFDQGVFWTPN